MNLVIDLETWRPVPDFPGYEVSDWGRVRSWRNHRGRGCRKTPIVLKPKIIKGGYLSYGIRRQDGEQKWRVGHRLMYRAFVGEVPEGYQLRHKDGDVANNRLDNMDIGTAKDNADDRARHGRTAWGERQGNSSLTPKEVREIRKLAAEGMKQRDIAARYGISQFCVWSVHNRTSWKRLPDSPDVREEAK